MNALKCLFLALVLFVSLPAKAFVVADAEDHAPLGGVAVMSANGSILGFSDAEGVFRAAIASFPVTVHCLGYEEAKLSGTVDTLFLAPKSFELDELVIQPVERPVLKLNCYIREYTTAAFGSDSVIIFSEYMADYFLVEKKIKGFKPGNNSPNIKVMRQRVRQKNAAGLDTIYRPSAKDEIMSWVVICTLDPMRKTAPDSVMKGSAAVSMGKYGPFSTTRVSGNRLINSRDILADHKGHHWSPLFLKVMGFTIDATEMIEKEIYLVDENGNYGPNTLQMATFSMEMTVKSKWIKKMVHTKDPIKTYSVIEVYPLSYRYLTQAEAKEEEGEYTQRDIEQSPLAPPLPPNILEMIEVGK